MNEILQSTLYVAAEKKNTQFFNIFEAFMPVCLCVCVFIVYVYVCYFILLKIYQALAQKYTTEHKFSIST